MIDLWVERPVVLDGGMYVERDATACFRIYSSEYLLAIESFTIDGVIYDAAVIEAQIGKPEMDAISKAADAWWHKEGYLDWRESQEWNGVRFYA